jgi:hypothetical protein
MIHEFRKKLEQCWCKSTSFSNGEDGNSRGQCYVTALLIYDVFGGKIMHGWITYQGKRQHHFWNTIIRGGREDEIDLTSDQYGGDGFTPLIKGEVYTKPNLKNLRFLKLKAKYIALYK